MHTGTVVSLSLRWYRNVKTRHASEQLLRIAYTFKLVGSPSQNAARGCQYFCHGLPWIFLREAHSSGHYSNAVSRTRIQRTNFEAGRGLRMHGPANQTVYCLAYTCSIFRDPSCPGDNIDIEFMCYYKLCRVKTVMANMTAAAELIFAGSAASKVAGSLAHKDWRRTAPLKDPGRRTENRLLDNSLTATKPS